MKVTRFLASLVVLGAFATSASAQGVASLNWDSCTGPLDKTISTLPGTTNSMFASVTNHSLNHKAYQVFVALGSGSFGGMRDAWRFDAGGCQGEPYIAINNLSTAKACPSFQPAVPNQQIRDYSFDPVSGKIRAVLANSYPAGSIPVGTTPAPTNPAVRYHLAEFKFDHQYSVVGAGTPGLTCGGLEQPVCAHFTSAAWLDLDGIEFEWAKNSEYVTVQDPGNETRCPGATPAENTSWGAIKAQYKR